MIGDIWSVVFLRPMMNALLWLYTVLGGQFWLAIIVFTILIRVVMQPLTQRQMKSAKRMQEMQPEIKKLQKKYKNDPQRLSEEMRKLGVSPTDQLTGCLPMLIQFPIWIGLYQSIIQALASSPVDLLKLSKNIYPFFQTLWHQVPLNRFFLGMDLSLQPSQLGGLTYALPILVAATMWLQQKIITPSTPPGDGKDDPAASMSQSMQVMMPLMFGFFSLNFSTGLSLYFIVSNIVGIVFQGFLTGWDELMFWKKPGGLAGFLGVGGRPASKSAPAKTQSATPAPKKGSASVSRKKKKRRRKR
jgi:YidC/Oxa1 family membrane protein insertase